MKIGIYCHGQINLKAGGDAVFQDTIVEELMRTGTLHEIFLCSSSTPAALSENQKGIRFIKLAAEKPGSFREIKKVIKRFICYGADRLLDREFTHFSSLEKAVREHKLDLIWFISVWTEKVTVPYIATVWDLAHRVHPFFPEVSSIGWKWRLRERHYRELLPRAACVITGTEAGKKEIEKYYQLPEHQIQVVPFPTPRFALEPTTGDVPAAAGIPGPGSYLFYPAQFWPHKNHIGLLLALKIVREKYGLDYHLVLTGSDKGNLDYVREQVGVLGLLEHVTFAGFVETDVLRELYRGAFALVYPTFFGPDNLPPLEAFALGCPVVASRVSGAEEQLGRAALLFDPKDPEEMALRIKELHDSPAKREELVCQGRERALSWTAADYVEQVMRIIDEFEPLRRCWSSSEPYSQS